MVFLHVAGVFGFLLAHGASLSVALCLRRERDPGGVRALLELSSATRGLMYGSLALLLAGGAAAATMGHWWGAFWVCAAFALLVVMTVAALALGTPHYRRLRAAATAAEHAPPAKRSPGKPAHGTNIQRRDEAELRALLASSRPLVVSAVGAAGLAAILWLMVFKPL
jgi:hypothetical protein